MFLFFCKCEHCGKTRLKLFSKGYEPFWRLNKYWFCNKRHAELYIEEQKNCRYSAMQTFNYIRKLRKEITRKKDEEVRKPMQPLIYDRFGVLRFKENAIVMKILDVATSAGYGLQQIALDEYTDDDLMQFAQLTGHKLRDYRNLSYVSDMSFERAMESKPYQGTENV